MLNAAFARLMRVWEDTMFDLKQALKSMGEGVQISRAPFVALGISGAFWGTFAAMVPELKLQVNATDAEFGASLIGGAIGGIIAMYFAPRVFAALGKLALPVLAGIMVLALQLPAFVNSAQLFFPMMILLGVSLAGLDVCANIRLSQLEERHGLHLMNLNHAMFSLGFGGAALFVSGLRQLGLGSSTVFPLMGLGIALCALLIWERDWQVFKAEASDDAAPTQLPWFIICMTSVMLFSSFIGENATESWSALFIERELGGAHGVGSLGPAMLGFVMCCARLCGQVTVARLGEERLLMGSGVLGAIGALALASAQSQTVALLAISIIAIGVAAIVPTANALLGKSVHSSQRALALSRSWMFGMSGFFIGPALMGFVSHAWGLRVAFVLVAMLVAVIIPAVVLTKRHRTQ